MLIISGKKSGEVVVNKEGFRSLLINLLIIGFS